MENLRDEQERRIRSLTALTKAINARVNARSEFGTGEELEEIGLITMRVALLEEHIAHHCEILLTRPELRGFYSVKTVLTRGLSDKLDLYKSLVIAAGTLHVIDATRIEHNISTIKDLGEERHTVMHGYLFRDAADDALFFRNKSKEIPANINALRTISERCVTVTVEMIDFFVAFYTLLLKKSVAAPGFSEEENAGLTEIGLSMINALGKLGQWHQVVAKLRQITGKTTGA
ncbi:MAG: hypothetical protein ABJC09_02750 [Terriglobia bacterium]